MKVYAFGEENAPVILLLPGTCCHWKGNFGHVIPLLSDEYRVFCVSYDGFDETERTEFPTMLEETAKIEDYLKVNCGGHIRAAYGCSLGGSFVGLLAASGNIRMDYGILGSSDLDQSSKFTAKLQTNLLLSLMFPMLRDGRFKSPLLQKRVEKQMRQMGDYGAAFLRILGGARPYLTQQSCKN
ncbi:MAG TPA: alpha/beta hydrolase [Clostridiales bacterium]|nr:alpha/beta hydrolase [Clostridiales bacterium]